MHVRESRPEHRMMAETTANEEEGVEAMARLRRSKAGLMQILGNGVDLNGFGSDQSRPL